jgi:xylulokinase
MKVYLGVDVGTYESKGALVGADGTILASAVRSHQLIVPQAGWAEHRAEEDWWGDFVWLVRRLIEDGGVAPSAIKAVGTSAIGPCMLPVDVEGAPLMNAVLYGVDTRAAREIDDLTVAIGAETILERCGNALTSQSAGPKILWLKRNRPETYARAHKFLNATSFLVHRLTGRFVTDHYSAANVHPMYLIDGQVWSDALSRDITDLDRLPDIAWTTEIAGGVTKRAAKETGLASGTPVIVGTIDAAAEAVSVGVLDPGDMMLMYGSTIFTILVTEKRVRDDRLWHAPWLFPGCYACMGGLATSGTLTHWFADNFARDLNPQSVLALLAKEAEASPPGANGLVFLPYFSGERTPIHDPHAKGGILGLTLAHSRADIYRALIEGIAFATNHIFETYAQAEAPMRSLRAVGGGLRNTLWAQATSDISGMSQETRRVGFGAAFGDAFLSALAIGDVSKGAIRNWNPIASTLAPVPGRFELYRDLYSIFREFYSRTRDLTVRLERCPTAELLDRASSDLDDSKAVEIEDDHLAGFGSSTP